MESARSLYRPMEAGSMPCALARSTLIFTVARSLSPYTRLSCFCHLACRRITVHDPLFLSRGLSSPMHTFSAPALLSSSFYVRLALSPCGRFLAAGSSGLSGSTSIFDVSAPSARRIYGDTRDAGVVLNGHTAEVGAVDWAHDTVSGAGCLELRAADEDC